MKHNPGNRAKCEYWLDRAENKRSGPSDLRYAADNQAALFADCPRAVALPLFVEPQPNSKELSR